MASDFTIIVDGRHHIGNEADYPFRISNVPFEGASYDVSFPCPNINTGEFAVLMYQTLGVHSPRNVFTINGVSVPDGIPVNPNDNEWNGNVTLIDPNVLRDTNNSLHIESRTMGGNPTGNLDDFIIDNVVVLYKTISLQ